MISHSRPTLTPADARGLADVIRSGQIAQGPRVKEFEQAVAARTGVRHAAAVSSGTAALHLALLALGVGPADEVIIPSFVCTALLNAVRYVGATPVLADIDRRTCNLDPDDVRRRLSARTKALIVPHMFGLPADMRSLLALGVPVVEDCAQAVGARYEGLPVGTLGDVSIFSFYATKVMTTGEGGMVVTNSGRIADRVKDLREYDKRRTYRIRYNYKLTELQAAVGLSQLNRLDHFIRRRNFIAARYDRAFSRLAAVLPPAEPGRIYFRYILEVQSPRQLLKRLAQQGIGCARPVDRPIHRYLKMTGYPRTDSVWRRALSIPIYPSLSKRDVDRVIAALVKILGETAGG